MKGIFKAVVALVCAFGSITLAQAQTTPNLGLGVPNIHSLSWGPVVNGNMTALDSYLSGGTALPASFWVHANAGTASALFATPSLCTSGQAATGIDARGNAQGCFIPAGGGNGTVTSFSSTPTVGTLFTTSVANATTSAAQTIILTAAPANSVFGNFTGASGTPGYSPAPVFSAANLTNFPTLNQNTTGNAATATVATSALAAPYSGLTGSVPTWNQSTTGNAATASALAGTPTLCSAGTAPTGILANGNATGCASISSGGITALTGDATASGSGSVAVTVVRINGTSLAGLATGLLKNTTATGVPTIAVAGTDYVIPSGNITGTASNITGVLNASSEPAFTGDVTKASGSVATTVTKINGVALSGLATGILKNTTTTGVPSIAVAADFPTLNQSTTGNAATAAALLGTPTLCSTGQAPTGILANGNATGCAAISGGGGISGLTTGFIPKASSATAIANSLLDDSITTAATLTYSGTGGISAKGLTLTGTSGGGGAFTEGTAPTGAASVDDIWADGTGHHLKMINNNGAAAFIPGVATAGTSAHLVAFASNGIDLVDGGAAPSSIANVTITGPTSAIAANTCTTVATVAMTGVTTSMGFTSAFATSPTAVTGWGASGGLALILWPTSNTVNWSVCNQTASSITPGAMTFNVGAK